MNEGDMSIICFAFFLPISIIAIVFLIRMYYLIGMGRVKTSTIDKCCISFFATLYVVFSVLFVKHLFFERGQPRSTSEWNNYHFPVQEVKIRVIIRDGDKAYLGLGDENNMVFFIHHAVVEAPGTYAVELTNDREPILKKLAER